MNDTTAKTKNASFLQDFSANDWEYSVNTADKKSTDGLIAIGTESFVYKGIKKTKGRENTPSIEIPCVLKFKPYKKYSDFITRELKIFNILSECRSVVKIDDVINVEFKLNIGEKTLSYFCVVEEFVDGMNLEDFCKDFWNGKEYTYKNILKYQKSVVDIMKQLAKIMNFVHSKDILHLDIKPQNIMITKHDGRVVLIDFGRAKKIISGSKVFYDSQDYLFKPEIDYFTEIEKLSEDDKKRAYDELDCRYGTLGYAPLECFSKPINNSKFPFDYDIKHLGEMTVASDIFAFGATFWEILNYPLLLEKTDFIYSFSENEIDIAHSIFYNNFVCDELYFERDLSFTHMNKKNGKTADFTHYRSELETIILTCTRKYRVEDEQPLQETRYENFSKLLSAIGELENSLPIINSEDKQQYKNAISIVSYLIYPLLLFTIIFVGYLALKVPIADRRVTNIINNYENGDLDELTAVSIDLAKNGDNEIYARVYKLLLNDKELERSEVTTLIDILSITGTNGNQLNDIIKNISDRSVVNVCETICNSIRNDNSDGYKIAYAINNSAKTTLESYDTLIKYKNKTEYKTALSILCERILISGENNIKLIEDSTGNIKDIEEEIKEIKKELTANW